MTGCSQPQYVGTTLNLDVASVAYNKDKEIAMKTQKRLEPQNSVFSIKTIRLI
jgi:hypothetical protein